MEDVYIKSSETKYTCFRVITMTSETSNTSEALPAPLLPFFTLKRIVLSLDLILYMAKYLEFEDYRRFIKSLWPNNEECEIVRRELWKLSTHQFATKFLNGKPLEVEYNFDPARIKEDRVLINADKFLPAIGYTVPPSMDKFINLTSLTHFIRTQHAWNTCANFRQASCPCHLAIFDEGRAAFARFVKPLEDACQHGHYHHYCPEHVVQWIEYILDFVIPHRHVGDPLDDDEIEKNLFFLDAEVRFRGAEMIMCHSL